MWESQNLQNAVSLFTSVCSSSNFWRGGTNCRLLSLEQSGYVKKEIVPLVQWGSGNENDSYVSQATTISSYSCHNCVW
jgi:hypothetical protein